MHVQASASLKLVMMMMVLIAAPAVGLAAEGEGHGTRPRGSQLFVRMVGADNNAPILPKTRSVWTQNQRVAIGNTGSADEGYTEYPFCWGLMDFTWVENYAIYPRIISGAQADETIVNTADMVIDHVYQPDGCTWGFSAREFVQTFTATQPELVSMTLLVASEPGVFRAALLEDGPGGRQIGPTKTFRSGHSMEYGTCRWIAGQAPLTPGKTYGLRMWREDGQAWMPYLHSTGNAYDGGMLYVDGQPRPGSDMAAWIVEEPPDLRRAIIEDADEEGWVYDRRSVWFVPRTPNIRMISLGATPVQMDPPTAHNCADLVIRVWDKDGQLIGGPKRGVACGPPSEVHAVPVLFAADELMVTPGERYRIDAYPVPHKAELPDEDDSVIERRDMRARVYGEPHPGALPAVFNLAASFPEDSKLKLAWSENFACPTRIEIRGDGMKGAGNKLAHIEVPPGTTEKIVSLWPGHTYTFRLVSTGPTGLHWRTPLYQVRAPRKDEIEALVQASPPYPEQFVHLAPPRVVSGAEPGPIRYHQEVKVYNPGFEEGLHAWNESAEGVLSAPDVGWTAKSDAKKHGIGTRWGDHVGGITHIAGEQREQVFAKTTLTQLIETERGHAYALSAMVRTDVKGGPRGDTRVRLFVDLAASQYGGENETTTQWYWTDGEWMRFEHRWVAAKRRTTIGLGFFRWRDIDFAGAYVDEVRVYDLGPAATSADAPFPRPKEFPALVLVDRKMQAEDKVEAYLQAPPGYVITGLGSRAHYDNITTMWMRIQPLLPDGTLGEPEQLRAGWEKDSSLEAKVELPEGYVATGFGAGIAPEWDVKRFGVWARPLHKDGTLGEEKLFRGGIDRESGFEKQVRCEDGRVLTGAGLNCMLNDVNGIRAETAELIRSANAAHAE